MPSPPDEFPDRFSPILVKELRQGLRTRLFVGSFMLLQVAMLFLAIVGLNESARGNSIEEVTGFFWVFVGIPLLLVMPGAGLGAISAERKAGTLELIFLTRLSARRILLGKFAANVLQSVLLVSAVVPYAVFRYFLGGVDLRVELQVLGSLLFASILLSGLAVGLSPLPVALTRTLAGLIALFSLQLGPAVFMLRSFGGMFGMFGVAPFAGWTIWPFLLLLACAALFLLLLMLEFGAGQIAPPAENHSTPIRLLAFAALGVAALFATVTRKTGLPALVLAEIFTAVICMGLVCETPRYIPSLYEPFVRLGAAGRLLGRFLYPGWQSAVFLLLVLTALLTALSAFFPPSAHLDHVIYRWWLGCGVLLLPVAVIRTLWPRVNRPFLGFFVFQVGSVLLFPIAAMMRAISTALDPSPVFNLVPLFCLFDYDHPNPANWSQYFPPLVVTALSLAVLCWRMKEPWRRVTESERLAATLLPAR